jgi:hypothetical protein
MRREEVSECLPSHKSETCPHTADTAVYKQRDRKSRRKESNPS